MKQTLTVAAAFAAAIAFPVFGYAQPRAIPGGGVDIGEREYALSCAVCHGDAGKGDGPIVALLKKMPTDLTMIQKNNGGVFPFDRLYAVIDGREIVAAHGPREMAVWGSEFRRDAAELSHGFPLSLLNAESFVRGRIVALIGYIYTLQAK
jgi:mono/diheme cytochrome c family protein